MAQQQAPERPVHQAPAAEHAGAKVVVACKLPAGLVIRGYTPNMEREAVMGGGTREYEVFRWNGKEATVFGTAVPLGQAPKCLVIGGYALTPGVDKDLWDNWFSANRDGELVKKHLIFAYERAGDAEAEAKNSAALASGFEPIDPERPGKRLGLRGLEKADKK